MDGITHSSLCSIMHDIRVPESHFLLEKSGIFRGLIYGSKLVLGRVKHKVSGLWTFLISYLITYKNELRTSNLSSIPKNHEFRTKFRKYLQNTCQFRTSNLSNLEFHLKTDSEPWKIELEHVRPSTSLSPVNIPSSLSLWNNAATLRFWSMS